MKTNYEYDVKKIQSNWIFEHYCNLQKPLTGQTVTIHSVFKNEKTASMKIQFLNRKYYFSDYSSGYRGDGIDLVKFLKKLSYRDAVKDILNQFNHSSTRSPIIKQELTHKPEDQTFGVVQYKLREWNSADAAYWTQYNISSELLLEYNVFPLEYYIIDNGQSQHRISTGSLYGYFRKGMILCKIYRPLIKKRKFIKVSEYIQGSQQLQGYDVLIIPSSLKDILSLSSLDLPIDYIAPDSETTHISTVVLELYLKKYKGLVFTLFDNDEEGVKQALSYKHKFGIDSLLLPLSKDPSDSMRDFGKAIVKETFIKLFYDKNIKFGHSQYNWLGNF